MRQLSFNMPNTIAFSQLVLIKKINKIVQIFPLYFLDRVLDPRGIETPHIIGPSCEAQLHLNSIFLWKKKF